MDEQAWASAHTDAFEAHAASGRYPAFAKVLRDLDDAYDLDLDAILELGLAHMLDGISQWLRRAKR